MMNQNGEAATTPPVVIRVKQGDETQGWLFSHTENLGRAERIASIVSGALIIYWFGRRLLAVVGLVGLALFLLYRGVSGYCPVTAALQGKRGNASFSLRVHDETAETSPTAENPLERELRRERQRDKIDQRSWESFPASDPPAHGGA